MHRTFAMSVAAMILVLAAWTCPSQEMLADPPSPKPVNSEPAKKAGVHLKSFTVTTDGTNYIFKGVIHNDGPTVSPKKMTARLYVESKIKIALLPEQQKKTAFYTVHLLPLEANKSCEVHHKVPMNKLPNAGTATPQFILSLDIPTVLGNRTFSKMATAAPAKESK